MVLGNQGEVSKVIKLVLLMLLQGAFVEFVVSSGNVRVLISISLVDFE